MAEPKLTDEQKETLCTWLAAEYGSGVILAWFRERGWPEITRPAIHHYRAQFREEIEQRRTERRSKALNTGLALKEERVQRLKQHADRLEALKWQADDKGKLHNEKAWRETLDDIAKEVGARKQGIDLGGPVGATGNPMRITEMVVKLTPEPDDADNS